MRGLADKRVLITGGASGIGAATVKRFLEEGSRVAVWEHDEQGCRRIEEEAPGLSGTITCDVSDPEAVKRAFIELDELFGGLDVLINNAGISIRHPDITEIPLSAWESTHSPGKRLQREPSGQVPRPWSLSIHVRPLWRRCSRRNGDDLPRQRWIPC